MSERRLDDVLDDLRSRVDRRRRAKVAGLAAAGVAAIVAIGGLAALAADPADEPLEVATPGGVSTTSAAGPSSSADPGEAPSLPPPTTAPAEAPTTVPTTAGPAPTAGSPTTVPTTAAPPPTSGSPTTVVAADPVDCGGVVPISGWPTTMVQNPNVADCILEAFASGTAARFSVVHFADEGLDASRIERRTYAVVGVRMVDVAIEQKPAGTDDDAYAVVGQLVRCRVLQRVPTQVVLAVGECGSVP